MYKRFSMELLTPFIICIIYILFVLRNLIISYFKSDSVIYLEFRQDAPLYVSQMNLGLRQESFYENPFFDSEIETSQVGRNYVLYLWGTSGRLLGLDLTATFLLGVLIVSLLFILAIYKLNKIYLNNKIVNASLTLVFGILIFGDFAFRPSPTQWALPLLIFALAVIMGSSSKDSFFKLSLKILGFLVILLFANPFYALWMVLLALLLFLGEIRSNKHKIFFSLFVLVIGFAMGRQVQAAILSDNNLELIERWGLLYTYFPGSLRSSLMLLVLIVINLLLVRNNRDSLLVKIPLSVCLATILVLQQNVVTGVWWEPESHFNYLVVMSTYLTLLNVLFKTFLTRERDELIKVKWAKLTLVLAILTAFIDFRSLLNLGNIQPLQTSNASVRALENLLLEETNEEDLILNLGNESDVLSWAGLLANRKFVWNYHGSLLSGSDSEIVLRYLCDLDTNFSDLGDIPNIKATQGHRFVNAQQHFDRWLFLSKFLPSLEDKRKSSLEQRELDKFRRVLPFEKDSVCRNKSSLRATKVLLNKGGQWVVTPYK